VIRRWLNRFAADRVLCRATAPRYRSAVCYSEAGSADASGRRVMGSYLYGGHDMLAPKAPSWVSEFRSFIMRGSVVDLAVGIIIGAAFTGVVNSLVKDVLNPILSLAIGGVDFSNLFVALNGEHFANLEDARKAGAPTVNFGLFINAIIQLLIVSFAIFWAVKALSRFKRQEAAKPIEPSKTEVLLEEIRDLLKAR
jgi:large conductance mechanosensitive channel